ncbi:hypothetical protein CR513_14423, partial [Mucuna pruriens]
MDMKKVTCAVLIVAASVSAAVATAEVPAAAPGPSSGASAALPLVGSFVVLVLNVNDSNHFSHPRMPISERLSPLLVYVDIRFILKAQYCI